MKVTGFAKELATVATSFNSNNQPTISNKAKKDSADQSKEVMKQIFKTK